MPERTVELKLTALRAAAIADVREATEDDWRRAYESCPHATFYHSPEWAALWREVTGGRYEPSPRLATFKNGATAVLPLMIAARHRGLVRTWLCSVAGTYGGWISSRALSAAQAATLAGWLVREAPDLRWRVNPFDPHADALTPAAAGPDWTHAIGLGGGFETILESWRARGGSMMRKVRKAERSGVSIHVGESGCDWRDFHAVYESSQARWGEAASSRYEWPLLERLSRMAERGVRLWLARREGEVVAGAVCLSSRRHTSYWLGGARASAFEYRPVNLLMHEIIRDAASEGRTWFDFNPSGGHEGVITFKRSFGATPLPCPLVIRRSARERLLGLARALVGSRS